MMILCLSEIEPHLTWVTCGRYIGPVAITCVSFSNISIWDKFVISNRLDVLAVPSQPWYYINTLSLKQLIGVSRDPYFGMLVKSQSIELKWRGHHIENIMLILVIVYLCISIYTYKRENQADTHITKHEDEAQKHKKSSIVYKPIYTAGQTTETFFWSVHHYRQKVVYEYAINFWWT